MRKPRMVSRRPAPLPSSLGEAFTPAHAEAEGVTRGRLRASDLERPFRGVRTVATAAPEAIGDEPLAQDRAIRAAVLRRARASALVIPDHAFFAGRTGGVAYGLPLDHVGAHGDELCVAVHAPHRALRRTGIRGIKVAPSLASVRTVDGLRVASPASVWAMLGIELDARQLTIVGDAIVRVPRDRAGVPRPHAQLATIAHLRAAAEAPGRRGRDALITALASVRVGSSSPLETDFRIDAAAAGLPEPELDVEIRDERGRLLGISELVYPQQRTVVEIEGDHHRTDRRQWNRDIEKYAGYVAAGWEVVRLTSTHVRGTRRAVEMVRTVLVRRGWTPRAP